MRRISPGRRACIRCTNPECGHDYFRPFFRHDRRLFAEVSRLIYEILREFYHEAAGSPLLTGMVIGHQSFGDQLRWNPHFHAIVSYGGFDKGRVLFHTKHSEYFKQNLQMFDALDFFAELTQHIPPKGLQLIRRYGLYASRTKGRRHDMPWVAARAPEGWKATHRHPADAEAWAMNRCETKRKSSVLTPANVPGPGFSQRSTRSIRLSARNAVPR